MQGLTALTLIREAYLVQKGDWVLAHAAAGGVGLLLLQLLRATGANIIATASTAEKLELAKEYGADYLVNYKEEDVVKRVKEITGGEGVAVVLDSTGKDQFENDLEVTARKGTIVSYGNSVSITRNPVCDVVQSLLFVYESPDTFPLLVFLDWLPKVCQL